MSVRPHGPLRIWLVAMPLLTAILVPGAQRLAHAQEIGDAAAGRRLAETWCNSCHAVGPAPQRGTDYGGPSFTAIARMPSTTPLSLSAFLQTPHGQMPDLQLSRNEIDDLTAYILSLRRP